MRETGLCQCYILRSERSLAAMPVGRLPGSLAPLGGQRPEAGHGRGRGGMPSPWPQLWQGQYRAGRGPPCHYLQTRVVTGRLAGRATGARGVKGHAGPGPAGCRLGVRSKARDSAIRDWRGSLGAVPISTPRHLGHTRRRGRPTRSPRKGHPAMHPHDEKPTACARIGGRPATPSAGNRTAPRARPEDAHRGNHRTGVKRRFGRK